MKIIIAVAALAKPDICFFSRSVHWLAVRILEETSDKASEGESPSEKEQVCSAKSSPWINEG